LQVLLLVYGASYLTSYQNLIDELIPIANKYGSEHLTNIGIIVGIFVMMAGLTLFE